MILGAKLETTAPLWKRVESALKFNHSPTVSKKPKPSHTGFFYGAGHYDTGMPAVPTWVAAALSSISCFIVAAGAFGLLESDTGNRVVQFAANHRLLSWSLIFGSQFALVLAIYANGNLSRRLKEVLSETQHYVSYVAGSAEIGFWLWSAETRLLWFTDQAKAILKLTPTTDYEPAGIMALINPHDLTALWTAIVAGSNSGAQFDVNVRLATTDGEEPRWLRCRGRSQTDKEGRITRIGGTLVDISEHIAMQTEINRQRQSLIHLSRVGTVGELSSALAHEISQPVTAIMNNAHAISLMLNQSPINMQEVRDAISDIIEEDSRVDDVIHHLRALLRKEDTVFGRVDMTLLIHKILGLIRKELIVHRVKPVVRIAPDFPLVWGDDVQLQQLLLNLIMNAIDAIESSGKGSGSLTITAYGTDGPEHGTYHLYISDTGGGFKPAVMDKLFEPFFSTKQQGLGLGLSISQAIVGGHNGSIRAENNNEGGATFHITLPAARGKPA
jgi:signal transduction histidine kinase